MKRQKSKNRVSKLNTIHKDFENVIVTSDNKQYRYCFYHENHDAHDLNNKMILFIGLNPKNTNDKQEDPQLEKLKYFSGKFNHSIIAVANLFALCGYNPDFLWIHYDPIGPDNDSYLKHMINIADTVVCCWGELGAHYNRSRTVYNMIEENKRFCLGKHLWGAPKIIESVSKSAKLIPY